MRIVASIQARLGSTRLPGKVLFHLGERRLLQWAIDRTKAAETIDRSVVAIGNNAENEAVETYCDRTGINHLFGDENNLLKRHRAVVDHTDCDLLVRITADCPFVPSEEIDRVVRDHLSNQSRYTTNVTESMPIGIGVDVIDPELLHEFDSLGETHPVKLARTHPNEWNTEWSDDPYWHEVSDAHLAVDTPADYWSLIDALDSVGDDARSIAKWLLQNGQ